MNALLTVARKEVLDALRDRRTWMVILVTSVLTGPILLLLLTTTLGDLRARAERREAMVIGIEHAPQFANFLARQGRTLVPAPADYEARIRAGTFDDAVMVVPDDAQQQLATGGAVRMLIVHDGNRSRSAAAARAAENAVRAFAQEIAVQRLAVRGVSPALLAPVQAQPVDLGSARGASAGLLFLVPFVAMFSALAGALATAIDTTSGERERGSLEPLLMNPVAPLRIAIGKWIAVASASITTLALTLASFAIAARFIRDDTIASVFQFGWSEAGLFAIMLMPFCALMSAFMMFTATFARTYKEAQAYNSYTMSAVAFSVTLPLYLSLPDAFWQLFVPAMGQNLVLARALRGAPVGALDIALPGLISIAGICMLLIVQARLLKRESIVFARA